MLEKLARIEERYEELGRLMADPAVASDPDRLIAYAQERAELEEIVETFRAYKALREEIEKTRQLLREADDPELESLARDELEALEERERELDKQLKRLLLPKDPRDEKNVIVEIRAGAGGDEAGLFAADLFRMYSRYAGWSVAFISTSPPCFSALRAYMRKRSAAISTAGRWRSSPATRRASAVIKRSSSSSRARGHTPA
jgi:peptide chain release factor 1